MRREFALLARRGGRGRRRWDYFAKRTQALSLAWVGGWAGGWAGGDGDLFDLDLGGFGVAALGLDFAELFEGAVELAGESRFVHAEGGEGAGLLGEGVGGTCGQEFGFEGGDAVEAPGGGGEGVDELFFESAEGLEVGEEALEVELELGGVLGGQEGGTAGEAMAEGVEGRAEFAGVGAGAGGELGVEAVGGGAGGGVVATGGVVGSGSRAKAWDGADMIGLLGPFISIGEAGGRWRSKGN